MTDFANLIESLAQHFLGEPNPKLSKKGELRYGTRGSLAINIEQGTWFDHELGEGGGALDFITRETGLPDPERRQWLDEFENGRVKNKPCRGNGRAGHPSLGKIVAVYPYSDENGTVLFEVVRFEPKDFRQRRPDGTWSVKGVRQVPYRLPDLIEATATDRVVLVAEGEKDVDNLRKLGAPATTNAGGAGKWQPVLNEFFRNANVVIIADNDPQSKHPKTSAPMFHDDGRPVLPGQDHAQDVADHLIGIARRVRVLDLGKHWKDCPPKGDVSDWIASGGTIEALWQIVEQLPDYTGAPCCTIEQTLQAYDKWLVLPDKTPVLATLGAVAANYLPGEPVWTGIVGPPSSAKTEILNSISSLPNVEPVATLTVAALLSGTPKKNRDKNAKGGLLRSIGKFGIISMKDFGSILSMHTETRAEVLAALRELFDGKWDRDLGTDGGKNLHWEGKLGLVFGATPIIDVYHAVIGSLGDRWLTTRMTPVAGKRQFTAALKHGGAKVAQMRKELAESVAALFAGRRAEPRPLTDEEINCIGDAIALAVRLRGAIERDRRSREIEAILGAEGTARIGLSLAALLNGLDVLGVERETAMNVVLSVAHDSVPPIRRAAYEAVCKYDDLTKYPDGPPETKDIALELGLPTTTTRRALEDLTAYGLIERRKKPKKGTEGEKEEGRIDLWLKRPWEKEENQ